jgi:hypothetical protein
MSGFWKRKDGLERRLRAERPVPREEFTASLLAGLQARERSHHRPLRLSVAAGVTLGMVVMLGVFGGFGYAAVSVKEAAHAAVNIVVVQKTTNKPKGGEDSSSHGEYGGSDEVCDDEGNDRQNTHSISKNAVAAYLGQHPRSHRGECEGEKKDEKKKDEKKDKNPKKK